MKVPQTAQPKHLPTHVNCMQPMTPKITEETNLILYQIQFTCNSGLSIFEMLHATYAQNTGLYTLHTSKWRLSIAVFGILSKTAHILRQTGRIMSSKSIPEYRMMLNAQLQVNIKSQISCTCTKLESYIMFNSFNISSNKISINTILHVIHSPLLLEKALACIPPRDVVAA